MAHAILLIPDGREKFPAVVVPFYDPETSVGLAGKPLFVLTSARTASAGEMLAYAARRAGVATIVGETTSGAGNGGRPYTIAPGLHLFVPDGR